MDSEELDYVIVGGGSAGGVLAARLSEDPNVSVGLLEFARYPQQLSTTLARIPA